MQGKIQVPLNEVRSIVEDYFVSAGYNVTEVVATGNPQAPIEVQFEMQYTPQAAIKEKPAKQAKHKKIVGSKDVKGENKADN